MNRRTTYYYYYYYYYYYATEARSNAQRYHPGIKEYTLEPSSRTKATAIINEKISREILG